MRESSTSKWIRQQKPRDCVHDVCVFVCKCVPGCSRGSHPLRRRRRRRRRNGKGITSCILQVHPSSTSAFSWTHALKTRSRCSPSFSKILRSSTPVPHSTQRARSKSDLIHPPLASPPWQPVIENFCTPWIEPRETKRLDHPSSFRFLVPLDGVGSCALLRQCTTADPWAAGSPWAASAPDPLPVGRHHTHALPSARSILYRETKLTVDLHSTETNE
jgi:hypothetical protein